MGKVLSDDKRDPHRFDPSPRHPNEWQKRGWRTRAEAECEPLTPMAKAEIEIERLSIVVVDLESMLHEISASLTNGPDIGPELPNAVKDELAALNAQIDDVATELGWPKKGDDRSLLEVVEELSELLAVLTRQDSKGTEVTL